LCACSIGRRSRTRPDIASPSRKKKKRATSIKMKFTIVRSAFRARLVAWPTIWSESQFVARRRQVGEVDRELLEHRCDPQPEPADARAADLLDELQELALLHGLLQPPVGARRLAHEERAEEERRG
jgi:hypothetical protein